MRSILVSFIIIQAGFSWTQIRADEESIPDQLRSFKDELTTKRAEFEKLGEQEQDQLSRLRLLEEQVALSGQLLLKIERAGEKLGQDMAGNQEELDESMAVLDRKNKVLKSRLRYLYKVGHRPALSEILLSDTPAAVLTAIENMKAILSYDRRLVESYNRLSEDIAAGLARLGADKIVLDSLRKEHQDELRQRKVTLDARLRLLDKLRKDKNVISRSMDKLEEDTREIAGIFEEIQAQAEMGSGFAGFPGLENKAGDLVWPTVGEIVRPFGTWKDKRGLKLTNPGIDIKAVYGSKVISAAAGRVIYVSWLRGYGQFIIIDHGQKYYTLYANLSSIMVEIGDEVKAGQSIAFVGDSGSLEGARLHFEVRREKEQLNPVDWLR